MHKTSAFDTAASHMVHLLTQEYTIELATTPLQFTKVKTIRKNVLLPKYSHFETIEDEENFLFNKDDIQAFIYLLKHRETNQYVGTVRIYFVNEKTPQKIMPLERYSHAEKLKIFTKILPVCEISRLALIKSIPKHPCFSAIQLRTLLTLGLMAATRINLFLYPYTYVFSIMEYSLNRILKRQGVHFKQIGEHVNYYGMRAPFVIERKKLLAETEETMGEITRFYLRELCKSPEAFWRFIDAHPYLERSDIHLDRICELFKLHGDAVDIPFLLQHS